MEEVNFVLSIGDCCAGASLCDYTKVRQESFIFDWAQSNLSSVCDIVEKGLDWHIKNNIEKSYRYTNKKYQFARLYYPHHMDQEYQKKCAERFFKVLNSNENVVFLYISSLKIPIEDLKRLTNIIIKNYKINFKIAGANSENIGKKYDIIKTKIDEYIDICQCNSPLPFLNNAMNDQEFYTKLFNILVPYRLNIKKTGA